MRFTSIVIALACIFLTGLACKEVPKPAPEENAAESPKHQAPQSLNELMGTPEPAVQQPKRKAPPQLPPGHPPIPQGASYGSMGDFSKVHAPPGVHGNKGKPAVHGAPPTAGLAPLKPKGSGSQEELERCLKSFDDEEDKTVFRGAFTHVFHTNRNLRNPGGAEKALLKLAEKHPTNAAIYRVLGYAAVDNGFQMARAMQFYSKAVELSPDCAEVHYALAFMYAMGDRTKGATHFQKAMELGMTDERGIGPRFYPAKAK